MLREPLWIFGGYIFFGFTIPGHLSREKKAANCIGGPEH